MDKFLMMLGLSLMTGLLLSRVAKKIGLPAVTAYIIAGVILGPFALGRLGLSAFGYGRKEYAEGLSLLSNLGLGFIAFMIGNEFRLKDLERMGGNAVRIGIFQAVFTTLTVDAALACTALLLTGTLSLSSALTLGAIAAATAPAATLMVVKQYKAHGPLTKLLLMVVALDDAVGLALFSISFNIAQAMENAQISLAGMVAKPLGEIVLSTALGVLSGWILSMLERFFHSRSKRLSLAVAFVMLTAALSLMGIKMGGIELKPSLLLSCMISGCVFSNMCNASEEIMERLDRWSAPILVLFFAISGAQLDFSVLKSPSVLMLGALYIIFRSAGKMLGAFLSAKAERMDEKIQRHLGTTLLPQAGVALGMANTSLSLGEGKIICNIILFSVFVYEIIGPYLAKKALIKAGEIDIAGRKSSRMENRG